MRTRRPRAILTAAILLAAAPARADDPKPTLVVVDRDDDDADGVPDGDQPRVALSPDLLTVPIPRGTRHGRIDVPPSIRVLAAGRPIATGAVIPGNARSLAIQALRPGRAEVKLPGRTLRLSAFEIRAIDGAGHRIDLARSHASLQRTPPDRLADNPFADLADPDAIRFVLAGVADDLPTTIDVYSVAPSGAVIDRLVGVPLGHVACPANLTAPSAPNPANAPQGITCGSTRPIRAVADDIDRNHPMVADRSIKARLGGALVLATEDGKKLQMIRVAGPRASAIGPIERYRAHLRIVMVRPRAGGPPPMGGDDAGAIAIARAEVDRANDLWAACGISFGPVAELDVRIVDPPRPHLLAIGCDHGLPASGGEIHLRVDGRDVVAKIAPGARPAAAARAVATAVTAAGFTVRISDNPVIAAGAYPTSDILIRRPGGAPASIDAPSRGPISTDRTLTACVGQVDLEDGLQHFGDIDAIAGTVEERALIKAFDDGDPATIDVLMVPSFGGGGRIGESFIYADGGAIRNTTIEDRAGLKADRASFALSHELGHVLLDDPGHPDDYGADTPTRLMDADAANGSAYGPRRLLVEECVRAIRQSGPRAPVPLLLPWPLQPLPPWQGFNAAGRGSGKRP